MSERDVIDADDLVDDDGPVDLRKLNSATDIRIDAETCGSLRQRVRTENARLARLAAEHDVSNTTIANHVRGECNHDHDVPPVTGDE